MRKTIVISILVIAVLLLGATAAMAFVTPDEYLPEVTTQSVEGPNFIDEDNDGVCDLMGTGSGYGFGQQSANFLDEDGDGVCDLAGTGQGFGSNGSQNGAYGGNFVDEDGDGQCDLMGNSNGESSGHGQGGRRGQGHGAGQSQGLGRNASAAGSSG